MNEPNSFQISRLPLLFLLARRRANSRHVFCADGEAKFWLTPEVSPGANRGLSAKQMTDLVKIIEERKDEITEAWREHFGR